MRRLLLFACVIAPVLGAERVDNVLAQMVPDDSVTLVGMRMEQLKSTPLFQKMVAEQKLPQLDDFARESGFDPRRDVRDVLLAFNGKQTVLLARGSFHVNVPAGARKVDYHGYVITSNGGSASKSTAPEGTRQQEAGFCILDSTLAVAGPLAAVEAALDQYKSHSRNNAAVLLRRAREIPENFQIWGVTAGNANFISENLPGTSGGIDFGRIFRSLQNVRFEADLRSGFKALAEGYCGSAQDAKALGDAARGMIGMGRLNTPENQPELLRVWDGIKVEQSDRTITITADIGQDLLDQFLKAIPAGGPGPKRKSRP